MLSIIQILFIKIMHKILGFIFILIFYSCAEKDSVLSLTFSGDVFLNRGVEDELLLHGDSLLIKSINTFQDQDCFIINYEGTFAESENYIKKKYSFKANKRFAPILKTAGVSHVSVANNHSYDYGQKGFRKTVDILLKNHIIVIGDNCQPVIIKKGKYQCGVLSASLITNNDSLCISSAILLKEKVKKICENYPSIPLVLFIHWGLEYQPVPEKWQRELAKDLVNLGVDAIIGHHPHVIQSVEFINNVPVFYSIGNFIADAYLPETDKSLVVKLEVKNKITGINIVPAYLEKYFPKRIDGPHQIKILQQVLRYSSNIGLIKYPKFWKMKKINSINFKEKSNLWLFSAKSYAVQINKLKSEKTLMTLLQKGKRSNTTSLYGSISEIKTGDVDNNGSEDILVGLSKKVKFDSLYKKRINIFSFHNDNLQPLWLGTKFIYDIVSFDVITLNGMNYLNTIEIDPDGRFYNGVYEWNDFGFALNKMDRIKKYKGRQDENN